MSHQQRRVLLAWALTRQCFVGSAIDPSTLAAPSCREWHPTNGSLPCEEETMAAHFIITEYLQHAVAQAEYDKLDDGSFSGRIPSCTGVIAFGATLHECERELRSALEDWLLLGFKLGHALPVFEGIDLNKEPEYEPVDAV